jgi:hypothetical protein
MFLVVYGPYAQFAQPTDWVQRRSGGAAKLQNYVPVTSYVHRQCHVGGRAHHAAAVAGDIRCGRGCQRSRCCCCFGLLVLVLGRPCFAPSTLPQPNSPPLSKNQTHKRHRMMRDGQALLRERVVFVFQKGNTCRVLQPSSLIPEGGAGAPFEVTLVDNSTRIEAESSALAACAPRRSRPSRLSHTRQQQNASRWKPSSWTTQRSRHSAGRRWVWSGSTSTSDSTAARSRRPGWPTLR